MHNNSYEDDQRAAAYARLEFPGTYYLAFRDLPEIINKHIAGKQALDFGCGSGRSTRFLKDLGFDTLGVDIAKNMINNAQKLDLTGDYRLIEKADLSQFAKEHFDLILAAFTFDNIPTFREKVMNLQAMRSCLKTSGRIILLVSSPDIYINEWLSFSTCDFPENHQAKSGDQVKIIITDINDKRAVEDNICFDEQYQQIFDGAQLKLINVFKPLAYPHEPFAWVNETRIAPWVIYVLKAKDN